MNLAVRAPRPWPSSSPGRIGNLRATGSTGCAYLMLSQDQIGGTMFERVGTDWIGHLPGADGLLHMPEIGLDVPSTDFHEGVALTPEEEPTSEPSP